MILIVAADRSEAEEYVLSRQMDLLDVKVATRAREMHGCPAGEIVWLPNWERTQPVPEQVEMRMIADVINRCAAERRAKT